jgi:GAF domain-containing protein
MRDATSSRRHREAQDLYHAWLQANDAADNSLDQDSRNDKNLLAIAQLAAIKLRTQRAIISLVDDKSQYILAEVSNTLSLCHTSSASSHKLLAGVASQPLSDAFYDQQLFAGNTPHPERSCSPGVDHFISTDCATDDRFKDHAFVKQEGGVRFAAGVSLITKNKHKVGVLVVLDESSRNGIEDTELSELKDCAQCVVRHLDLVQSSTEASKETSVLRGIAGQFADQYRTLPDEDQHGKSGESTNPKGNRDEYAIGIATEDYNELADSSKSVEPCVQATFNGVAKVLRDCSLADGAVIFGPPAVANLTETDEDRNPDEHDEHKDHAKLSSHLLASSLRDGVTSSIGGQQTPYVCALQRLASVYPRGALFDVTDDGVSERAAEDDDQTPSCTAAAKENEEVLAILRTDITYHLAGARSLVYLPVYDQSNGSLLASCFAWRTSTFKEGSKHQHVADYHVLGNFLSHDIAQLRMQNEDAEQKKFMSNFSHELRTPINGILGSAQFLQDTVSDDYQSELLQSIVVSSNTLLDTASDPFPNVTYPVLLSPFVCTTTEGVAVSLTHVAVVATIHG